MDDAYRAGMHAGDLRRIALELERSLPSGEWRGPSELECRLRVMDIHADLLRVARLLEIADALRSVVANFGPEDIAQIAAFEEVTKHDVKAIEYYVRDVLKAHQPDGGCGRCPQEIWLRSDGPRP